MTGLEPGDPYVISVRALGFVPQTLDAILLALGELRKINFEMQPIAARMDTVSVSASTSPFDRATPAAAPAR